MPPCAAGNHWCWLALALWLRFSVPAAWAGSLVAGGSDPVSIAIAESSCHLRRADYKTDEVCSLTCSGIEIQGRTRIFSAASVVCVEGDGGSDNRTQNEPTEVEWRLVPLLDETHIPQQWTVELPAADASGWGASGVYRNGTLPGGSPSIYWLPACAGTMKAHAPPCRTGQSEQSPRAVAGDLSYPALRIPRPPNASLVAD